MLFSGWLSNKAQGLPHDECRSLNVYSAWLRDCTNHLHNFCLPSRLLLREEIVGSINNLHDLYHGLVCRNLIILCSIFNVSQIYNLSLLIKIIVSTKMTGCKYNIEKLVEFTPLNSFNVASLILIFRFQIGYLTKGKVRCYSAIVCRFHYMA